MTKQTRQELFDYMSQEHGILLFRAEMDDIEDIILKDRESRNTKRLRIIKEKLYEKYPTAKLLGL